MGAARALPSCVMVVGGAADRSSVSAGLAPVSLSRLRGGTLVTLAEPVFASEPGSKSGSDVRVTPCISTALQPEQAGACVTVNAGQAKSS